MGITVVEIPVKKRQVATGALTAGNANAYAFNWQNPHSYKIKIDLVVITITTSGGTAGALLDVGTINATDTHSDNLIDAGILETGVTVPWALNNFADAGTNGKTSGECDENGGGMDWITGQILIANAAALVGSYYIYYTPLS